jgi:hypothetical protein
MKILEKNLLKLGFKREKVSREESGDKPFHYFTFEIGDLCLITCANYECVEDSYTVEFFDYTNSVMFTDLTVLETLIKILNENKK